MTFNIQQVCKCKTSHILMIPIFNTKCGSRLNFRKCSFHICLFPKVEVHKHVDLCLKKIFISQQQKSGPKISAKKRVINSFPYHMCLPPVFTMA